MKAKITKAHFKTIIVGVDFSDYSRIVVKQARVLADAYKVPLIFVHCMTTPNMTSGEYSYVDMSAELLAPTTQEVISFYGLKKFSPMTKAIVKMGRISDEIIAVAQEFKIPLIIIGHKGKSSVVGRFFAGSTAEQVGLRSPFPVWVHRGNNVKAPKNILLPCDFSRRTKNALETVSYLTGPRKLKYEFFHVEEPQIPFLDAPQWKKATGAMKKKEHAGEIRFHDLYPLIPIKKKQGRVGPLIINESKKFDLVVMAPHNRKGIFLAFGSVTAKVLRSGSTPVLITR